MFFRDVSLHHFLLLLFSLPDKARKAGLLNEIHIKIPNIPALYKCKIGYD